MASFAAVQTRQLVKALDNYPIASSSKSSANVTDSVSSAYDRDEAYRHALSSLRADLRNGSLTPDALSQAIRRYAPRFASGTPDSQTGDLEALFWVNATIEAYGSMLQQMIGYASQLQEEIEYWRSVEEGTLTQSYYLLQTGPTRALRLARFLAQRAKEVPNPLGSNLALARLRQLSPPSLLVACLFPALVNKQYYAEDSETVHASAFSGPRLFSWSYSPWLLASQEARIKRKALRKQYQSVTSRIGTIATYLQSDPVRDSLASATLSEVASSIRQGLDAADANTIKPEGERNGESEGEADNLAEHIMGVLNKEYPREIVVVENTLAKNARPQRLVRHWPKLVFVPIAGYIAVSQLYQSRAAIRDFWQTAQDTIKGFVIDWVVEPCIKILETVRHGDQSLALMGKASLSSDLDSLERMVVDFDREVYGYRDQQLADAKLRVREGDLSEVLKAWEQDIKTPIKSALVGSLVRTLLIQIQKVKVDVDLAMNGIEKMLQSQQLTFAFVGVAPSLLILFGAVRWLRGSFNVGSGQRMKKGRSARRRVWLALRTVDKLLQRDEPSLATVDDQERHAAQRLGSILVELQVLRSFADSRNFPSKDAAVKYEFIYDIRQLETAASVSNKRRMISRFWQIWSLPLGFASIM